MMPSGLEGGTQVRALGSAAGGLGACSAERRHVRYRLLGDGEEVPLGTDPLRGDTDGDGLDDGDEVDRGTNPRRADTDRDGIDDAGELERGTDPLAADSDGDGLTDGDEVARGTDPLDPDSDDDGLDDGADPCVLPGRRRGRFPRHAVQGVRLRARGALTGRRLTQRVIPWMNECSFSRRG